MVITFLASLLIWGVVMMVVAMGILQKGISRKVALRSVIAFAVAMIIAQMLKGVFGTPRPFVLGVSTGLVPLTLTVHHDYAFPSGHTAAAVALAAVIWMHNRRLGTALFVAAMVIGSARVLANVHWPIDIVGGAFVGLVIGIVIERVQFQFARR